MSAGTGCIHDAVFSDYSISHFIINNIVALKFQVVYFHQHRGFNQIAAFDFLCFL